MSYAVDCAKEMFKPVRLVMHSEVSVPNVQIPDFDFVGEAVDPMTPDIVARASMGTFVVFSMAYSGRVGED